MMKRSLKLGMFACISILFVGAVHAQQISIGARGGLSIPNLTGGNSEENLLNSGYSSINRTGFAVFANIKFSDLFSLRPMIEYSAQGGHKDGFQALTVPSNYTAAFSQLGITLPEYLWADYKSKAHFNYLQIPILAEFGWNLGKNKQSPFRIYGNAGPFIGFLLNAHQITSGTSIVYADEAKTTAIPNPADPTYSTPLSYNFDATTNIKNQLHSTNFGIEGNVGISYKIKRSAVFIEGGGNYGLLYVQKGTANGKNRTGAATVMIGYSYALK